MRAAYKGGSAYLCSEIPGTKDWEFDVETQTTMHPTHSTDVAKANVFLLPTSQGLYWGEAQVPFTMLSIPISSTFPVGDIFP